MNSLGRYLFLVGAFLCMSIPGQSQDWTQWGLTPQHTLDDNRVVGQQPDRILANVLYDHTIEQELADLQGYLLVHYQVPLVEGNDVYMEFKTGKYSIHTYSTENWGENKFTWIDQRLVQVWSFQSDWKAPGSIYDFDEPVFHPAVANGFVYVPGAGGTVFKLNKFNGKIVSRINPFSDHEKLRRFTVSPISVDENGDIFYNVLQMRDAKRDFFKQDAEDSWIVKVAPDDSISLASYKDLVPGAPKATDKCTTQFIEGVDALPWPPSPTSIPKRTICGTERVALNIAPAIAPDGTIYSVTRSHFNDRWAYLVAINPDLTPKWAESLRHRFHDGCGVTVADGGSLPPNGRPGGCRVGANYGVDPGSNAPGDGRVIDDQTSTPVVAPDGSIFYGAFSRYNWAQGHLMHFDANGNFLNAFNFGFDDTPAVYRHDGTYSVITKNNHYGDQGSYCNTEKWCPSNASGTSRDKTNPDSPQQFLITQFDPQMRIEWNWQNTNTLSCKRDDKGEMHCIPTNPDGFEFCVNAPVVDRDGRVYVNSEDGNLYVINQGGTVNARLFQELVKGAAYTPASLGPDGKIYSQSAGRLFVAGR